MADHGEKDLLLGKQVRVAQRYSPQLLYPIARSAARTELGLGVALPFYGADLWHAYEISWLDETGRPVSRVGRFTIPATSPCMVESKSFKLYLNSINNHIFPSEDEAVATILRDLSATAGAEVSLELLEIGDARLAGADLEGECLDGLPVTVPAGQPDANMLKSLQGEVIHQQLYSHLLRSLCPVTGQPDWATVWVEYRGRPIVAESLLAYVLAYRQHQEFHEQCVERMFCDIMGRCRPESLQVQAFYTRRGGLDINPFRSTDPDSRPLPRLNRQ